MGVPIVITFTYDEAQASAGISLEMPREKAAFAEWLLDTDDKWSRERNALAGIHMDALVHGQESSFAFRPGMRNAWVCARLAEILNATEEIVFDSQLEPLRQRALDALLGKGFDAWFEDRQAKASATKPPAYVTNGEDPQAARDAAAERALDMTRGEHGFRPNVAEELFRLRRERDDARHQLKALRAEVDEVGRQWQGGYEAAKSGETRPVAPDVRVLGFRFAEMEQERDLARHQLQIQLRADGAAHEDRNPNDGGMDTFGDPRGRGGYTKVRRREAEQLEPGWYPGTKMPKGRCVGKSGAGEPANGCLANPCSRDFGGLAHIYLADDDFFYCERCAFVFFGVSPVDAVTPHREFRNKDLTPGDLAVADAMHAAEAKRREQVKAQLQREHSDAIRQHLGGWNP